MHIVFLSPEVWPFTRVGGLAEVARDLPLALGEIGHRVEIVTPKCRMDPKWEALLEPVETALEAPVSWRRHKAEISLVKLSPQVNVYFVSHEHLFDRDGLYGNAYGDYEDNCERFIFYSRACMELILAMGWEPDIIHANDWTTGLVPLYLKSIYSGRPEFDKTASVMTVHNLANQGVFWHYDMPLTGLGWDYFTPEHLEFFGKINFLKAGLVAADVVSTVSKGYAREILQADMGCGLEGVLESRADGIQAIVNGLDYNVWNPAEDPILKTNFDAGDLGGRAQCRADLKRRMEMDPDSTRPVALVMGRLLDRRGLDILAPALEHLLDMGLDVAVMGHGEDHYHAFLRALSKKRKGRMALQIGYDTDEARRFFAGGDLLLMPSRFEPCGLHQMQAMRYGTIPVVRATGGLDDTVMDHTGQQPGDGFKFIDYQTSALLEAVRRALDAFEQGEQWRGIMRRAMNKDFSWRTTAPKYVDLYEKARRAHLAGRDE